MENDFDYLRSGFTNFYLPPTMKQSSISKFTLGEIKPYIPEPEKDAPRKKKRTAAEIEDGKFKRDMIIISIVLVVLVILQGICAGYSGVETNTIFIPIYYQF